MSTRGWYEYHVAVELCDAAGQNLLQRDAPGPDADEDELDDEQARQLQKRIAEEGIQIDTLAETQIAYVPEPGRFWDPACNEQPPLHPSVHAPRFI